jgi:hypothetical protein
MVVKVLLDGVETNINMVVFVTKELPYKVYKKNKFRGPDTQVWWVKVLAVESLNEQKNNDAYSTDICVYDIVQYRPLEDRASLSLSTGDLFQMNIKRSPIRPEDCYDLYRKTKRKSLHPDW